MAQSTENTTPPTASVRAARDGGHLTIVLGGRLDAAGTGAIWNDALAYVRTDNFQTLTVDCGAIEYLDGAGLALLLKLREAGNQNHCSLILSNLREDFQQLVDLAWSCDLRRYTVTQPDFKSLRKDAGQILQGSLSGLREMVSFVGETAVILGRALRRPRLIRTKDVLLSCLTIGVDSLFIIVLIGFLMGLIMSFQSAVSLQQFGGEIFVPNMLGLVMFREMGPLVTAILLAARSGSAFAAEIGTMKINEELDALVTMGLSPMRFLVLPKLLATLLMVPFMTLFFNLASLIGGAIVMLSLGFPLVTFTSRVFAYLDYGDFFGGMFKAFVFAILVAGVGCLRGIQTKDGASAVGLSTTSAVVTGIICIAVADGIFAISFYFLGW